VPAAVAVFVLWRWTAGSAHALYALVRMLGQLLIVGHVLTYIFETDAPWPVLLVLTVMVMAASWIALSSVPGFRRALYRDAIMAIVAGAGSTAILITQGVLTLEPWFEPSFVIPLAGMIFAAAMNAVSLCAERALAELGRGMPFVEVRTVALRAGLIPIINSLFAVGLVSLPGLMTGQILSGVSPLIAARYQMMVMFMVFGSSGMSAAAFLWLLGRRQEALSTPS